MKTHHAHLVERLRALAASAEAAPATEPAPAPQAVEAGDLSVRPAARTLRVDIATLDRILDLTGEIAVARGRLSLALESADQGKDAALEVHHESERLHADLQELVMRARMVPLGPTLSRAARTLREAAAALGKAARLVIDGEDVEVDTKVAELIADPLIHLVRNAVAHGIEGAAERQAAGKDPCGTVTITAARQTGSIVVTVSDDGTGLQRERILEMARRRGLVVDGAGLGDEQVHRFIFEPGFSTAGEVGEVSGRGVGLDVVRRNVESLRGSLTIASLPGRGATFTIQLPLTLAIIPGFAVDVADETFLVPLESVVACVDLPVSEDRARPTGILDLHGDVVPYVRLRHRLDVEAAPSPREHVLIVQHQGRRVGLVADRLLGDRQAVIKPLGRLFRSVPGVAGSTILGDGHVALLLDVAGVVEEATTAASAQTQVL